MNRRDEQRRLLDLLPPRVRALVAAWDNVGDQNALRIVLRNLFPISLALALLSAMPMVPVARAASITRAEVIKHLTALRKDADELSDWSYDASATQLVYEGETQSAKTEVRVFYSKKRFRSSALQLEWRDGQKKAIPDHEWLRTATDIPAADQYTHLFADANRLLSYQVDGHSPDEPPADGASGRSIALYEKQSPLVSTRVIDLPYLWSRVLLGYEASGPNKLTNMAVEASTLEVISDGELVEGNRCVVVRFKNDEGTFTLWLDPILMWQPRRATVTRLAGDQFQGRLLWEALGDRKVRLEETYSWQDFKNVRGIPIPTRFVFVSDTIIPSKPTRHEKQTGTMTVWESDKNPSFDVWSTDDIPDGIRAYVFSTSDNQSRPLPYVWSNDALHQIINENRETNIAAAVDGLRPQDSSAAVTRVVEVAAVLGVVIGLAVLWWRRRDRTA